MMRLRAPAVVLFVLVALQACSDDELEPSSVAVTDAGGSSSGASSSSGDPSGASSSGDASASISSSSGATPGVGDRCDAAAARTEARYDECGVEYVVLDGGTPPPCDDARAENNERLADCVQQASCAALRGDADAGADADAYFACLAGE